MGDAASAGVKLEDLSAGTLITGVLPGTPVQVIATTPHGPNAVTLFYSYGENQLGQTVLTRDDEPRLARAEATSYAFTADPEEFKLAAEATRIRMAASFDPMLAVNTSSLEPLPHQIQAVYGHMLARHTPLRFLLADDPGAGKTIMAGLYIKELMLRGDLHRCLVVAPGGLVEQWQDELLEKFELSFEILTRDRAEAINDGTVFEHCPLLIARMDQIKRPPFLEQLKRSEWDLVVVDEAHRMSARRSGGKLERTSRYRLGQALSDTARHFLLMTATPHAGNEENFQLFLRLLDRDRFEGVYDQKAHQRADTTGLMRRMIKEDLLTFDGKPLFPERQAKTINYELDHPLEKELYKDVTNYVRYEMNQADKLKHSGDTKRGNTVGFALTILQRRLASSPQAILRSLERRRDRLTQRRERMRQAASTPGDDFDPSVDLTDPDDLDDQLTSSELEKLEESVVDAATAAQTLPELDAEIASLNSLVRQAREVFAAKVDRKWQQLSTLLDSPEMFDSHGEPRKLIVFTEHRDTLNYLVEKIRNHVGQQEAVVSIHGGMSRDSRRETREVFTEDRRCRVLVATDAAGEGLNLQRANLMVNYDLPWNPNKIEQRFGRIHRIGQTEVCHLWNLVATNTREGEVFQRLLGKVSQQQKAYKGRVFDVLGEAFHGTPLRSLLMEAIRYGDQPEVKAKLDQVINERVGEGLAELIERRSAQHDKLAEADVAEWRLRMDQARARRLQPNYVKAFFLDAFARMRGRISQRETARYEITRVPARVRDHPRSGGFGRRLPERYTRVTFDRELVRGTAHRKPAALLAPGHPLLDAVVDLTIEDHGHLLREGTLLIDDTDPGTEPRLLVAVIQEITDSAEPARTVSKRFDFVELNPDGSGTAAGEARYLDYRAPTSEERAVALPLAKESWLAPGVERLALSWSVENTLPQHRDEVTAKVTANVRHVRRLVEERLTQQINYWDAKHLELQARVAEGKPVKVSPEHAQSEARKLERRLEARLLELEREEKLNTKSPLIAGAALVVPGGRIDQLLGRPPAPDRYAADSRITDRRAVAAVLRAERALGRFPEEMPHNNRGFDIRSRTPDDQWVYLEVKGRVAGAETFWVTRTEALTAKNMGGDFRLALVSVHPDGAEFDEVRYIVDPFRSFNPGDFSLTGVEGDWAEEWARGGEPR